MQISLSKISDVPLHQQLAEQIVFLITTGKLRPAEQLPSVRALATYLRIHHNTVSKSYQDLVQRGWINRHRGSRMCVGTYPPVKPPSSGITLDELLDQSIQRASQLGYSLQELRERVMQRLSAQPPDHVLVVENEPELRRIICEELLSHLGRPVKGCTIEDLAKSQEVAVGALIVSPDHLIRSLKPMLPSSHQSLGLTFADALEQVAAVRNLAEASVIGVVSISKSFLKTARSLLAPAISRRHSLQVFLAPARGAVRLDGIDVALCDSITTSRVKCRRKIPYQLISTDCLQDLAAIFKPSTLN